jgi:hypothetical protein
MQVPTKRTRTSSPRPRWPATGMSMDSAGNLYVAVFALDKLYSCALPSRCAARPRRCVVTGATSPRLRAYRRKDFGVLGGSFRIRGLDGDPAHEHIQGRRPLDRHLRGDAIEFSETTVMIHGHKYAMGSSDLSNMMFTGANVSGRPRAVGDDRQRSHLCGTAAMKDRTAAAVRSTLRAARALRRREALVSVLPMTSGSLPHRRHQ